MKHIFFRFLQSAFICGNRLNVFNVRSVLVDTYEILLQFVLKQDFYCFNITGDKAKSALALTSFLEDFLLRGNKA
jgi:hypothetical protein